VRWIVPRRHRRLLSASRSTISFTPAESTPLCRGVLGFPADLVYGRILPGAAISILVGNVAYALQARRLAAQTGRTDVCALPYGINTVSLFAHVFLVMLPAKTLAIAAGAADPARVAWQAGPLRDARVGCNRARGRADCRARTQGDARAPRCCRRWPASPSASSRSAFSSAPSPARSSA
jgi:hypothetical protein